MAGRPSKSSRKTKTNASKSSPMSGGSAKLLVTFATVVGVAFVAGFSCQISAFLFNSQFEDNTFCGFVGNHPAWLALSAIASIGTILLVVLNNRFKSSSTSEGSPEQRLVEQKIGEAKDKLERENFADRVDGVTELEEIAQKSPSRHPDVMKILMGFVKRGSPLPAISEEEAELLGSQMAQPATIGNPTNDLSDDQPASSSTVGPKDVPHAAANPPEALMLKPSVDILVAVKALANRNFRLDGQESLVDLAHANMRGSVIPGAYLKGANLQGVNFSASNLEKALLSDAVLHQAWLQGTNLWSARLPRATLIQAKMSKVNLEKAVADRAQFWEADMRQALLGMASFQGAKLGEAKMIQVEAVEADFTNAYLVVADLRESNLRQAKFVQADLRGADLSGVKADKALFIRADLSVASLVNATLANADFHGALLNGTVFRNTNLRGANVCGANLSQIRVEDEILLPISAEMRNLSPETYQGTDFNQVLFDEHTIFPDGFRPDRHGMVRAQKKKTNLY